MALYTDFEFKAPPAGKYEGKITVATSTDEQPIAQAVAEGKEARTLATEGESEHSDDGQTTTDAIEAPNSERQTALERLRLAELESEQDLRSWAPLTEADAEAKQEALSKPNAERYNAALDEFKAEHPDFEEVMARAADVDISEAKRQLLMEAGPQAVYEIAKDPEAAQRFAAMSDSEASALMAQAAAETERAKTTEGKSDYDRALEQVAAQGENVEQFVEKLQKPIFPASEEGYAKFQVLGYALNQVSNRRDVVLALAKDSQALAKIATADTPDVLAAEVHKLSARLKFGQTAQSATPAAETKRRLGPTRPVGGSARGTVPMDQMSYQEYRAAREKQIRARRVR